MRFANIIERWNVSQLRKGSSGARFVLRFHTGLRTDRLRFCAIILSTIFALVIIIRILTDRPLLTEINKWTALSPNLQVYSAHLNLYKTDIFVVTQLIKTKHAQQPIVICSLMYKNLSHTQVVTGIMTKLHSVNPQANAYIVKCQGEPYFRSDIVALRQVERSTKKYLVVQRPPENATVLPVGICAISYNYNHPNQVEFLIHHWNLGVRDIIVYGYKPGKAIENLIKFHLGNETEFLEWEMQPQRRGKKRSPDQSALIADCTLRLTGRVEHIIVINTQEFLIPISHDLLLGNIIPKLQIRDGLAYTFNEKVFCNERTKVSVSGYPATTYFERLKYLPAKYRSGLLMKKADPSNLASSYSSNSLRKPWRIKELELYRFVQEIDCNNENYTTLKDSHLSKHFAKRIAENTLFLEYNKLI